MARIIEIENLSKKYLISTATQGAYNTLVDTLALKAKYWWNRVRHPRTDSSAFEYGKLEEFWALKNINLHVEEGDRLGIIGRNGAGKSTLLKLLSRITEPTTGSIKIRGRVSSLLEVGTGFHPELTGRENIFLNGAILGMSHREIKQKFDEIVAFSEVEKFLDTPVKRFSSGMITRLGFAIAAYLDPDLLIVDEVLAVGDAQFQQKCLRKMNELGSHGRTVLFVSHDVGSILTLCNKGIYLEKGQLKAWGPVDESINAYLRTANTRALAWEGSEGDDNVRFTSATLCEQYPMKEFFFQGENTTLDIEYEVLKPNLELIVGFGIWNQRHQLLGRSHTSDDVDNFHHFTQKGKHKLSFKLDAGLFHEGEYLIKVDCFIHNKKRILSDEITLKFPIYAPKKNTRFSHMHEKDGIFLGNRWELKPQSSLDSRIY